MKKSTGNALKLRKGAWGSDEDKLLRRCIEKYGEGKWHLVPQRAGLNRCRKSCRLRWLNYLRPCIKRGEFSADEVDLMMRLHKLLGNRWSLIAGRLPGRTANDVKNFWNTNLQKKLTPASNHKELIKRKEDMTSNIATTSPGTTVLIKPLPRTLSKGTYIPCYNFNPKNYINSPSPSEIIYNNNNMLINKPPSLATPQPEHDGIEWWKDVLAEIGTVHGQEDNSSEGLLMVSANGRCLENMNMDAERSLILKTGESSAPATEATGLLEEDGRSTGWSDIWDLLNSGYD